MFQPGSGTDRIRATKLVCYSAAFVPLCYLPFLAPRQAVRLPGVMIFWSFFCTTVIILCDEATSLLKHRSLLAEITSGRREFLQFVAAGTISGLLLDGSAQWLAKLWIYPYWTTTLYIATFVLGFCTYWLLLAETYLLGRILLAKFIASKPRQSPACAPTIFRVGPTIFRLVEIGGIILVASGLSLALRQALAAGRYRFDVTAPSQATAPFLCLPLIFTGIWLLLESVQFRCGRDSLLGAALRREWLPLSALLLAAWVFGFFMETVNTALHFWRYTNWPLENELVFGVPVVVLLLWPLQYVVFLEIYQYITGRDLLDPRPVTF